MIATATCFRDVAWALMLAAGVMLDVMYSTTHCHVTPSATAAALQGMQEQHSNLGVVIEVWRMS